MIFKPIIAKLELQRKEHEALLKETALTDTDKDESDGQREQSSKSATRKWWQFWK